MVIQCGRAPVTPATLRPLRPRKSSETRYKTRYVVRGQHRSLLARIETHLLQSRGGEWDCTSVPIVVGHWLGGTSVDQGTFDGLTKRLAGSLPRRLFVGGSLVALVSGAVGPYVNVALAKKRAHRKHNQERTRGQDHKDTLQSEACVPSGRSCSTRKRAKHKKKASCARCCQGFSVTGTDGKQRCACAPLGASCSAGGAAQCCSGACQGGVCVSGICTSNGGSCSSDGECCSGSCDATSGSCKPAVTCRETGSKCAEGGIITPPGCCSGVCNNGGSNFEGTQDACAACLTGNAACTPSAGQDTCCGQRICLTTDAPDSNRCCSLTNETCDPTLPDNPCCQEDGFSGTYCPASGPGAGTCCIATGDHTATCLACCAGACNARCCAPAGQNPTASGGNECVDNGDGPRSDGCCRGTCDVAGPTGVCT